jgi:hypothetical protein
MDLLEGLFHVPVKLLAVEGGIVPEGELAGEDWSYPDFWNKTSQVHGVVKVDRSDILKKTSAQK